MDVQIVAAVISAAVAATVGIMTWFNGRANLREQRIAQRRRSIAKQLNEFYGPLISYLNITKSLYRIFIKDKPTRFRTLTYLIDREQEYQYGQDKRKVELTESDEIILGEIVEIEKKIELLIIEKGGLVEDPKLMFDYFEEINNQSSTYAGSTSLATLITHFRVLSLAYEGKLKGDVNRYEDFVFPREMEKIIHKNYNELHKQLKELSK